MRSTLDGNRRGVLPLAATLVLMTLACGTGPGESPGEQPSVENGVDWYRGNLHTHSLWSDGDQFPETVIAWYRSREYDFIALSDHNTIGAETDRWIPVLEPELPPANGSATHEAFEAYRERFGDAWVDRRERDGKTEVRLKTFAEFESLLSEEGAFLILPAEEITSRFEEKPIHVNATNIVELVEPAEGSSVTEVMQKNVDAVLDQRRRTGRVMFPHINHPNFGWAVSVEDMMALEGDRFFEVYNGHPLVHNEGDHEHPSTETMWDMLLAHRLRNGRDELWGLAVDDAHDYQRLGPNRSNPGRAWIMVRSPALTAAAIVESLESGDFYGTTGVLLDELHPTDTGLSLNIRAEPGITYRTEFIGVRVDDAASPTGEGSTGVVFAEVEGASAAYSFRGDELYVRARITSSKSKENPYIEGELERAWIQPNVRNP